MSAIKLVEFDGLRKKLSATITIYPNKVSIEGYSDDRGSFIHDVDNIVKAYDWMKNEAEGK